MTSQPTSARQGANTAPLAALSEPEVVILLASYQGARFLPAQLDSIAAQSHRNWSLIISDDGSTDGSRDIVDRFACRHGNQRVTLVDGPCAGATANFLHLLQIAPEGKILAFSDQDDVWMPQKLARAVTALHQTTGPTHYAARTLICDEYLRPLAQSRHFRRPFGFRNALIQACMAGNTSVFNAGAARILKAGAAHARDAGVVSHDWWAYQLLSGSGGQILRDHQPVLHYRQHGRSEIGRNDTALALIKRLGMLFTGDFGQWLHANTKALAAAETLTDENRRTLAEFGKALELPGPLAAARLRRLGLYRHTRAGSAAFHAAALAGRLRQRRSDSNPSR